jgi:FADH2 O2-dependent halogenase
MTGHDATGRHDVVIVGRHLTTSLLAAILARHGVRVALIRTASDGARPAGETTVPYTAELFFLLGAKFGIPEIGSMGMFGELPGWLRGTSGVKRNLGFLYHRAGTAHDPAESLQFTVPAEHAEWHLYRPDVDEYAAALADRYGAVSYRAAAAPGGVRVSAAGVSVALADGQVVDAGFLVDGSGAAEVLADGLPRLDPGNANHRARLLYAHLTGVRTFDSVVPLARYGKAGSWTDGTLLHAFDGGWVQVAPFGNHADSANPRWSVAASFDPRRFPAGDREPDADFGHVAGQFPELRSQFAGAEPERPWVRFDQWPARVPRCHGPRWFLFDRSAVRQDLLLSRDLAMSLETLHATATALLAMAGTGDWAGDGMATAAAFQLRLFDWHDRFVAAGRVAASDFALWNAYLRSWLLWSILSALSLKRARMDGPAGHWSSVEGFDQAEYWYPVPAGLPEFMRDMVSGLEAVSGGASPAAEADRICRRLRRERFVPPLFAFGDPGARYYRFSRARRLRMLLWTKTVAPADFRRLLTADNVTAVAVRHQ